MEEEQPQLRTKAFRVNVRAIVILVVLSILVGLGIWYYQTSAAELSAVPGETLPEEE